MSDMFFNGDSHQREQEEEMELSPFSCSENMKTSPSYLEWDVQFNYPDAPTGEATRENMSNVESQELNTLMEVIDEHKIIDTNEVSSLVSATPITPQPYHVGHSDATQPINIQGQTGLSATPGNARINSDMSSIGITPPEVYSVVVPPASDTRRYNQFGVSPADSSIADSPVGGFSLYNYQKQHNSFTVYSPRSALESIQSNARTPDSITQYTERRSVAYQTSEDAMSPAYRTSSPAFWQQPSHLCQVNLRESCDDVFISEEEQQAEVSLCNFKDISSPSSVSSDRTTSSMTEEQRLDARRKRNNLACRESRKRRKKLQNDKEASALQLEEENKALKLHIKQLERDVAQAQEDVQCASKLSQS